MVGVAPEAGANGRDVSESAPTGLVVEDESRIDTRGGIEALERELHRTVVVRRHGGETAGGGVIDGGGVFHAFTVRQGCGTV